MKKYLLTLLLLLATITCLVACGLDENPKDTDVDNPVKDQTVVDVPNDTDESDTFVVYLPDEWIIARGCYLVSEVTVGKNYEEEIFDMDILKEEYQLWKNIDGGALYEVTVSNNGATEVLKCMISLGD